MDGRMDGRKDGWESGVKDCLQQSKICIRIGPIQIQIGSIWYFTTSFYVICLQTCETIVSYIERYFFVSEYAYVVSCWAVLLLI